MSSLRKFDAAVALSFASAVAAPAWADTLPEKGPNGGMLRESGEHHIELVVSGQTLTVHLLDHKNKPTPEGGVIGTAIVIAGGTSETITLADKGNGVFVGTGKYPPTGSLVVDVSLKAPGEPRLTARFSVER